MSTPATKLQPVREKWSGLVLTVIFLAIATLIFVGIYLAFPQNSHYGALLLIGVIALLFCLITYFAEAFSRDPTAQRSLAWGFFGMGFAVLFLSLGLGPTYGVIGVIAAIEGLIVVLALLFIAVGFVAWRGRSARATANQEVARSAWRQEPAPNAFSYATANSPSVPSTAPAPPASNSPPPGAR